MNKVNGYCQIELPDRITLESLTTAGATLTKAEAKPIIENLGLGGIKFPETEAERTDDWYAEMCKIIADKLINKPLVIAVKRTTGDIGYSSLTACLTNGLVIDSLIGICFVYLYGSIRECEMYIDFGSIQYPDQIKTIYDAPINIVARKITTSNIE